eukprot:4781942-Amphidinium_carterae.1
MFRKLGFSKVRRVKVANALCFLAFEKDPGTVVRALSRPLMRGAFICGSAGCGENCQHTRQYYVLGT